MSKSVLISIQPKWCKKIVNGEKTIEVRKTRPKIDTPFKCYVYCTEPNTKDPWKFLEIHSPDGKIHKGNGKVIGEFICDAIFPIAFYVSDISFFDTAPPLNIHGTCLTDKEIAEYLGNGKTGYGWHISDLKIYEEPKKLSEFRTYNPGVVWENGYPVPTHEIKRPPQSWCYVEEI